MGAILAEKEGVVCIHTRECVWMKVLIPSSRNQATLIRVAFYCSNPSVSAIQKNNTHPEDGCYFLAEKEGFEPSIPFWGIHDFQSCALGQLRDFSKSLFSVSQDILQYFCLFVKR